MLSFLTSIISAFTGGLSGNLVAAICAFIIYIVATVGGVFIAVGLWFAEIAMAMNANVVGTTFVQTGFSVLLSVANLGFVLGIIVVALATILRHESYGIKTILWKLVIMAIMVNFVLVIAAPLLNFSNSITTYFINGITSTGSNGSGSGNGLIQTTSDTDLGGSVVTPSQWYGYNSFANAMTGLFQPQRFLAPENSTTTQELTNFGNQIGNSAGSATGQIIGGIIGLLVGAFSVLMAVIVVGVFCFMLIIRYLQIAFLLVIAPFAWMLWIFPKTSRYFSQWWDHFIRWTFFPPIVVFFIWLVVDVGNQIKIGDSVVNATTGSAAAASSGLGAFAQAFATTSLTTSFGTLFNSLIVCGLLMGGIYLADKMSITGASTAITAAKSISNSVKGYAGRKATQAGTAPLRTTRARQAFTNMQNSKSSPLRYLGRGLETLAVAGGEKAINKKGAEGLVGQQKANRLATSDLPTRIAILQTMSKEELGGLTDEQKEKYFGHNPSVDKGFAAYGKPAMDTLKKVREESGLERNYLQKKDEDLRKIINNPDSGARDVAKAEEDLKENRKNLDIQNRKDIEGALAAFMTKEQLQRAYDKAVELQKKTGKPIPDSVKIDDESIEKLTKKRMSILGTMARSTPDNFNAIIKELSKRNDDPGVLKSIFDELRSRPEYDSAVKDDLLKNEALLKAIANQKKSTKAALFDYATFFGLSPAELAPFTKRDNQDGGQQNRSQNRNQQQRRNRRGEENQNEEEEEEDEDDRNQPQNNPTP